MPAIVNCHHHYSAKSPSIKPTLRTAIDNVVCFPHTKPTLIPSAWLICDLQIQGISLWEPHLVQRVQQFPWAGWKVQLGVGQFAVVSGGQVDAKNFITQESFHLHFVPDVPHTT